MRTQPLLHLWQQAPLLRLLPAFIAGILLQSIYPAPSSWLWATALPALIAWKLLQTGSIRFQYRFKPIAGAVFFLLFAIAGAIVYQSNDLTAKKQWIGNHYRNEEAILATLTTGLKEKANSFQSILSIEGLIDKNTITTVEGKAILYIRKDSTPLPLNYGDRLIFFKPLQPIAEAANPGSLDYKRYNEKKEIYYQVFLENYEYRIVSSLEKTSITRLLQQLATAITGLLKTYIPNARAFGLAEALLLGSKQDLDYELLLAFAQTGVVHLIAISGLHLGLLFAFLSLLLKPIRQKKPWLFSCLIIATLWLFALLTGGSASVLRSALMFSCVLLARPGSRNISVFHSLSLSAFLLLSYSPAWLFETGFQLSYLAVLSIVLFSKPIYQYISFSNKLLDLLWKLAAVTIAAQLLTTPLCLYYFHQFPVSFLLTNLLAIPLTSIILTGEIICCILSFIPPIASLLGQLLQTLILLLTGFVEWVNHFPWSSWQGISIGIGQTILLYAVILSLALALLLKHTVGYWLALLAFCSFLLIRCVSFWNCTQQRQLLVYQVPGSTAIEWVDGRNAILFTDSVLLTRADLVKRHLEPSQVLLRIKPPELLILRPTLPFFFELNRRRFLLLQGPFPKSYLNLLPEGDCLVLGGVIPPPPGPNSRPLRFPQIVLASSVSSGCAAAWKRYCNSLGLSCWQVNRQGAFVIKLP